MWQDNSRAFNDSERRLGRRCRPGCPRCRPTRLSRLALRREGHWVLTVDGFLDRPALSEHIFSHPQDRQVLEGILHPLIAEESQAQITNALQSNALLVVYDAALLFESGRAEAFRPIIVVSTSVDIQIQRLMERDELTRNDAHKRIDAQMPVREKAQQADFVIHNDGSLSALQDAVNDLWKTLCP